MIELPPVKVTRGNEPRRAFIVHPGDDEPRRTRDPSCGFSTHDVEADVEAEAEAFVAESPSRYVARRERTSRPE